MVSYNIKKKEGEQRFDLERFAHSLQPGAQDPEEISRKLKRVLKKSEEEKERAALNEKLEVKPTLGDDLADILDFQQSRIKPPINIRSPKRFRAQRRKKGARPKY